MNRESAEVRSDQPAPSVDRPRTEAGRLLADALGGRMKAILAIEAEAASQPPATPSLREALERLADLVADCYEWDEGTDVDDAMIAARAALASSDPGSPSESEG